MKPIIGLSAVLVIILFVPPAIATIETVEEQESKDKCTPKLYEKEVIQDVPSVDKLVTIVTAVVIQGVDSNPLLDSTKKADNYPEEMVDMHFTSPVFGSALGFTNSKFGFNLTNVNYYRITDVNIFDGIADLKLEQEVFDRILLGAGYALETFIFPNNDDGSFVGNEFSVSARQKITDDLYQKAAYRLILRNYTDRKIRMGNLTTGSALRADARNIFEHELGLYVSNTSKLKLTNQFYINESNDQYLDFYDYLNYRIGVSVTHFFTRKLYTITGMYYQRRNYESRIVSDKEARQQDNLYLASTSFMYDITKDMSIFVSYSHTENHSNEPLEKYSNNLYSTGLYYSF